MGNILFQKQEILTRLQNFQISWVKLTYRRIKLRLMSYLFLLFFHIGLHLVLYKTNTQTKAKNPPKTTAVTTPSMGLQLRQNFSRSTFLILSALISEGVAIEEEEEGEEKVGVAEEESKSDNVSIDLFYNLQWDLFKVLVNSFLQPGFFWIEQLNSLLLFVLVLSCFLLSYFISFL